ncbi:cytochrome P450 [Xylaria telfairii]|nr:cytochrome P450 [Xylaria telfairii]
MAAIRVAAALALVESVLITRLMSYGLLSQYREGAVANAILVLATTLVANLSSLIVWWTVINPTIRSPFQHLPRPTVSPENKHTSINPKFLTSFQWLLLRVAFTRHPRTAFLSYLSASIPNNGILALWGIVRYRLLLTTTDVTTELLVHRAYDFTKLANIRQFMTHLLGSGLVVLEGEPHKILRKSSLQAFGHRQVQSLYPAMWDKALSFVGEMEKDISRTGGVVDMASWAYKVTVDVIGIAVLGRDFDSLRKPDDALIENYKRAIGPGLRLYRILAVWLSFEFVQKLPWGKNRVFNESTAVMKEICRETVLRRKKEIIKAKRGTGKDEVSGDILSQLIKTSDLSDVELADQLLTYLIAGHDTTQSAFLWACYLLTKHPEWQKTLREEIRNGLLTNQNDLRVGDRLEKLAVLNGVVHETLRLYPVIPVTSRVAVRDTMLGGVPIPKGTEVLVSPWVINHAVEAWGETAGDFDPARWIDADGRPNTHGGARSMYDFATFLHGPRSCIGMQFAKAELRCLIAALVSRFEWELAMADEDVVPGGVISITPLKGLRLKLRKVGDGD